MRPGKRSIGGSKYGLVVIDDFSRFTWVVFLRTKDKTRDSLIKLITQVELESAQKVKMIRSVQVWVIMWLLSCPLYFVEVLSLRIMFCCSSVWGCKCCVFQEFVGLSLPLQPCGVLTL